MNIEKYCRDLDVNSEELVSWVQSCALCHSVSEAFVFDTEFKVRARILRILKRWILDPSYRVRVLHRVEQLYFAKEMWSSIELDDQGQTCRGWRVASRPRKLLLKIKIEFYAFIWQRLDWRLRKDYQVSISPIASIDRGHLNGHIWEVGVAAGVAIGPGLICARGVRVVRGRRGAPKIGADVKIHNGAVLVGNIAVGDRATIGALSLVVTNVPSKATIMGGRAKPIFPELQRD